MDMEISQGETSDKKGYTTIDTNKKVLLTANGISNSIMELSEAHADEHADVIYAKGVFTMGNGKTYQVGDVAIINDPKLANILVSKNRVKNDQIDRGEAAAVMRNMGTPYNLTGVDGQVHYDMRAMAEGYFTNEVVSKLYGNFAETVKADLEGKNYLEIDDRFLKRMSLKMMLQTMGEDANNSPAIDALEKILMLSELRLEYEIKDMLRGGIIKDQFNFKYSPFKQKVGPEMEIAMNEFYAAIGDGKKDSFFHKFMKDPNFAKTDWVETLALGSRSLQVVLGGALFEAFSENSEITEILGGMKQDVRKRSVALVSEIVSKQGIPVKYITRINRSNKPLMSGKEELKDSEGNPLRIKKGTRIVYNMDWVFKQTKDQTYIYGAGAQKCIAIYMVPVGVLAAFDVAREIAQTKEMRVLAGDKYEVIDQDFAPLQVVKTGFRAGSNRE
jgi:hypothetical protein